MGSVLATMSVTIERLIAVVAPLHRMKKSTSIRIMVASFIVSVVYNQPRFFEIETVATKAADQDDDSPVSETIKMVQFIRDRNFIKTKYYFEYNFNHICYSDGVCSANSSEAESILYPSLPYLDENCIGRINSLCCDFSGQHLDGLRVSKV